MADIIDFPIPVTDITPTGAQVEQVVNSVLNLVTLISTNPGNGLTIGSDGKLFANTGIPPATFQIASFANDKGTNEKGATVSSITFNWAYANGTPVSQAIAPIVGTIANNALRTTSLTGQNITADTTFTLSATDGVNPRTAQTNVRFFAPIFYGTVPANPPTPTQVSAMTKRIAAAGNFTAGFDISSAYSCVASPMATPITDILDDIFGLSVLSNYDIINNVNITLAGGSTMLYRVLVSKGIQDTAGADMNLRIVF